MLRKEFAAQVMAFDKKGEGDEIQDDGTLVEVTDFTADGHIELAFNDRNERCYLKFRLADLMTVLCTAHGNKE